jgi:CPA1 family monovalent cation:H+ antiporter
MYHWAMTDAFPPVLTGITVAFLVLVVTALSRRLPVPTPILQVVAGLLVGLVPGTAGLRLEPSVVFFVFLPPVLWAAAYFTSFRDFKANLRPICLLAIGLVLATTAAVAGAAHALLPGLPWPAAVALGAIVSAPDAVAAEAILKRLPIPRRVVVILEGESLVNDASALVLYRTAVVAAVTGFFSLGEAIVRFFIDASVGVLVGLAVGWLIIRLAEFTRDALAEVILTLVGPYLAWVAAERIHVSAVLACVAGGLYVRQHFSSAVSPASRLQARAVWDLLVFMTNALIFILLGVQFGELIEAIPTHTLGAVGRTGLLISGMVILVRLLWVPVATALPRLLSASLRLRDPMPPFRSVFLLGWTSMRGVVSLASALALPLALGDGRPFPYRAEIVLITMCVIVVTLVVQGLSLAPLIRWLRFPAETTHHEEVQHARQEALRHALEKIDDLADESWVRPEDVAQLREQYTQRSQRRRLSQARPDDAESRQRLRLEVLNAERRALIRLRNEGAISDEVLHHLERELDVEALRIGAGEMR